MTGHDGDVSPPSTQLARTRPTAPRGARRSMRWVEERVPAGSSSAATVGSPPPPTEAVNSLKDIKWGIYKKRSANWQPRLPWPVGSPPPPTEAVNSLKDIKWGIYKKRSANWRPRLPWQQGHRNPDVEAAKILLMLRRGTPKEIKGKKMKGVGSAVAEGVASSSVAGEGQRKTIGMQFDPTKKAAKK